MTEEDRKSARALISSLDLTGLSDKERERAIRVEVKRQHDVKYPLMANSRLKNKKFNQLLGFIQFLKVQGFSVWSVTDQANDIGVTGAIHAYLGIDPVALREEQKRFCKDLGINI